MPRSLWRSAATGADCGDDCCSHRLLSFTVTCSPREIRMMPINERKRTVIAHVIYRLDIGGMENGLVNIVNHMPHQRYRHVVICLDRFTDFRRRIRTEGVEVIALNKRQGQDFGLYTRLWKLFRQLQPDIVHTRNIGTLEASAVATLAGVRCRVHGEHGWDVAELGKRSRRYLMLRRLCKPCIARYIAVSRDIARWLESRVGVCESRIEIIYNGVDTDLFYPREGCRQSRGDGIPTNAVVIGMVGRLEPVKDPLNLIRAFAELRALAPKLPLWLLVVGDGSLRKDCLEMLSKSDIESCALIRGFRDDIPDIMRSIDIFVLPSVSEGLSNTILEAMASGLPIVATDVGGNSELVVPHKTGQLVPAGNPSALARAMQTYAENALLRRYHGDLARAHVERNFSIGRMAEQYTSFYDKLLPVRR